MTIVQYKTEVLHRTGVALTLSRFSLLSLLLVFSIPQKGLALGVLALFSVYSILVLEFSPSRVRVMLAILATSLLVTVLTNGVVFIVNYALFWLLFSPILLAVIYKSGTYFYITELSLKKAIEDYLLIQILFSVMNGLYVFFYLEQYVVNVAFGDNLAGTFRAPFTIVADSANQLFSLTMIITLFVYSRLNFNKYIFAFSVLVIITATTNHLIIAAIISIVVVSIRKISGRVLLSGISLGLVYLLLESENVGISLSRLSSIWGAVGGDGYIGGLGFKGVYIVNALEEFSNVLVLLCGTGAGTYSSRAALLLLEEYTSFPFANVSSWMSSNTQWLWDSFLAGSANEQGAFNYPFFAHFSHILELGIPVYVILLAGFYRWLKHLSFSTLEYRVALSLFLFIVGFVDNYYEYFQSFIVLFVLSVMLDKVRRRRQRNYRRLSAQRKAYSAPVML